MYRTPTAPAASRGDAWLTLLLRGIAGVLLLAVFCALLPGRWMRAAHESLGLGVWPEGPLIYYLTRSLSALYGLFGLLLAGLATDVNRYRPLIRLLGLGSLVFGLFLLGVDLSAGMPSWWTATEGISILPLSVLLWWLASPPEPLPNNPLDASS